MHCNIYCSACCLIRTYCISKNRILNCKVHTVKESVTATFLSCFRITDHTGRTHLGTGCCQCQDRSLRKCLLWNSFTTMKIPDIHFRIRQSICNRLRGIQNGSTSYCKNKVYAFFFAKLNSFSYKRKFRIRNYSAKLYKTDVFFPQTILHLIKQSTLSCGISTEMYQDFLWMKLCNDLTDL